VSLLGFEPDISKTETRNITVWTDLVANTECRFPYTKHTVYKFQTYSIQWRCYTLLIQHLQHNSTNLYTYLIQKVANFSLHFSQSSVTRLSYWKTTCFFFPRFFSSHTTNNLKEFLILPSSTRYKVTLKLLAAILTSMVLLIVQLTGCMELHTLTQMYLKLAIHDFITPIVSLLLKHHSKSTSQQTSRVFPSHPTPLEHQSVPHSLQFPCTIWSIYLEITSRANSNAVSPVTK